MFDDEYHGMGGSYIVDPKTGKRLWRFNAVPGPGELELTWVDDKGVRIVEKLPLNVA